MQVLSGGLTLLNKSGFSYPFQISPNGSAGFLIDAFGNIFTTGGGFFNCPVPLTGTPANCEEDLGTRDTGTARITNGLGHVMLPNAHGRMYHVTVTPLGDCRGLYVLKTSTYFVVRELQGGRSTLPFDYRVEYER